MIQKPLNDNDLAWLLDSKPVVLVAYHATWCGACVGSGAILAHLALVRGDLAYALADVDKCRGQYQALDDEPLPAFGLYSNGRLLASMGTTLEARVLAMLDAHLLPEGQHP